MGVGLADRIARFGSLRFDEYVEHALYDPTDGFFGAVGTSGSDEGEDQNPTGRAGRAGGDFITSPEVGPLFGAVVARYLDARWEALDRPDPFVVVEAGAGRGALAISVLAASPRCAPALRYVMVERSDGLRARQADHLALAHPFDVLGPSGDADSGVAAPDAGTGPLVCSLPGLPVEAVDGVILANELLDNVPFRLFERGAAGWDEIRVGLDSGRLAELLVPADADVVERLDQLTPDARPGARVPLQDAAVEWLRTALGVLRRGSVLVIDYATSTTASLADRPVEEWLRTYRGHERGSGPLDDVGAQDITVDVCIDQLAAAVGAPASDLSQADWLRRHGIEGMVAEGRRIWDERAGVGDLAALRARSRAVEAEALCDPTGLGAFRVLDWHTP